MFNSKEKEQKLLDRLSELTVEVKALVDQRDNLEELEAYRKERDKLRTQINDLKIDKSKIDEEHAREMREVEHKIGLLRRQQDQDAKNSRKQAMLEVREANLEHEKNQFEEQMAFREKQFDQQSDTLKALMEQILGRLPTYNIHHNIDDVRESGSGKANPTAEIEAPKKPATRRSTRRQTS